MNVRKLRMGLLVMAMAVGIMLTGCNMEPDEPTYTVWIETFTFTSSDSGLGTLQDGYYRWYAMPKDEFDWFYEANFQTSRKYAWTEGQIHSYLLGWGLSYADALARSSWLASVTHGYIVLREGSYLYMILK